MSDWTGNLRELGVGAGKEIKSALDFADRAGGWMGRRLKNGHIMLRHSGGGSTVLSATPSDRRAGMNARAMIKREGVR